MGVLNVTPDSFSDGGEHFRADAAIAHGLELAARGAHIVDVGGESTRPGARPVTGEEERRRVIPVIEALAAEGVEVSIDTMRADTALAAVAAGACVVNDVSGGRHDPAIRRVAAETGALYIAMHWRGIPDPGHERSRYGDVVAEVRDELARLADDALAAGVAPERLVLDPGLGFDKTAEQGWRLLAELPRLTALGFPVLVGVSRKRMLAETLGPDATMADRDTATAVVSALAAGAGAWGVRVHEVAPTVQALAVARAWSAGARGAGLGAASRPGPRSEAARGAAPPAGPVPPPAAAGEASGAPRDRIALTGLEVFAHHGVFGFEREHGQRFLVDVELSLDLRPAAAGDALERTVHYGELAEAVVAAVGRDPVDLIETVAERAAGVALGFAGVAEARVTVHKPDAPIAASFSDVSVTVVRGSEGGAP
jgi:dihydropteroate synthase/dihydroneopterin aldolase